MAVVGQDGTKTVIARAPSARVDVGLAIADAEILVEVGSLGPVGPPGPPGTSVMTFVQALEPDPGAVTINAGDFWIKKPPDDVVPQPVFIWDGAAWLPIYGAGGGGGTGYEHVQATPSTTWSIYHLLGYEPRVTVKNEAGNTVHGSITYIDNDNVQLDFSEPIAGTAYLS